MPNNLAGTAPSVFYPQLLHLGGGTLAAGAPARLGNGAATPLYLDSGGTGTQLPDGRIIRHVDRLAHVASDMTKSAADASLAILTWSHPAALAAGRYRLRGLLLASTTDAASGVFFGFGGSGIEGALSWAIQGLAGAVTGFASPFLPSSAPGTSPFLTEVSGILTVAAPAPLPELIFNPETPPAAATLYAGSWIELQRYI